MTRIILATYLALFTAAGPSLCCCTTLASMVAGPRSVVGTPAANCCGAKPSNCCCAADMPAHADGSGRCSNSTPAKSPEPAPCPCKEMPSGCCFMTAPFTAPPELSLVRWTVLLAQELPAFASVMQTPVCLSACTAVAIVEPFWPAADLLHVHHRLRC